MYVSVSPERVRGLHWSTANLRQEATFTVSAEAEGAPGTFVMTYEWSSDGLLFDDPTAQTTTARAIAPGKFTVNCGVTARNPAGGGIVFEGSDWETVAAIGGPLQLGVTGKEPNTGTPEHEVSSDGLLELPAGSWYVQYFGYDRSLGVPSSTQLSQMGTVQAYPGQPAGVSYGWTVPPPLKYYQSPPATQPSIVVCATSGSAGARLKVDLTYYYVDPLDPSLTGEVLDDSDETPPLGTSTPNPNYYRFIVAKPVDVTDMLANRLLIAPPVWEHYGVRDTYRCTLKDDGAKPMPGVWLAERFYNIVSYVTPTQIPDPTSWITYPVGSHTQSDYEVDPPYVVSVYGGQFIDFIQGSNPSPLVPPNNPIVQLTQKYFAATLQTQPTASSGLLVATYEIKIWTDRTTHTK